MINPVLLILVALFVAIIAGYAIWLFFFRSEYIDELEDFSELK